MRAAPRDGAAVAGWLRRAGFRLEPEEAVVLLEAARVLLPPELGLEAAARAGTPATPAQREALRALWLRTGAPPRAPVPMPLHPLAPGVLGTLWRRVRESLARTPTTEAQ
jgi:hypothetical protein